MENQLKGAVSVLIKAPAQKVWDALTDPSIIQKYFFGTQTETEWKVGGPIRFRGEYQGKKYQDKGTVLAFEPYNFISYTYWSSMSGKKDLPENYLVVNYRLSDEGEEGTRVEIAQENLPDEKTKVHALENWKQVLAKLKMLLEESAELPAY